MIYIASPFSHENKLVEKDRYLQVEKYALHLINEGLPAFSPIVYCYPIHLNHKLDGSYETWKKFNLQMLHRSEELHILCLDNWDLSLGVRSELDWWLNNKLGAAFSTWLVNPDNYTKVLY